MNCYFYRPYKKDPKEIQEQILNPTSGKHRFFRLSGPLMQRRFTDLIDCSSIPPLLIHGNPHIANYCKTSKGTAMVDFDRSRVGPYSYDIVRFLVSVSFCDLSENDFLHPVVIDHFRRGYMFGLLNKKYEPEEMHELRVQEPRKWQMTATDYLESGKKWAKKLFGNEVDVSKKRIRMLESYFESRKDEETLKRFKVITCAEVAGSMGKLHHLFLLQDRKEKLEPIIIDIKEVYKEKDNEWFTNPFSHNGIRMNAAGSIYAPGWEQMPGHASHDGEEFWGRQIPLQQVKLAAPIEPIDQCDLCFSVAAQLGRGHSRASDKYNSKDIFRDFKDNFDRYVGVAKQIQKDIAEAHEVYCAESIIQKYSLE